MTTPVTRSFRPLRLTTGNSPPTSGNRCTLHAVFGVKKRFRLRADTSAAADPMTHESGGIQMAPQEILTMSQIVHKQGDGSAQIATNNGVIQPGTHSFADQNALNAYL